MIDGRAFLRVGLNFAIVDITYALHNLAMSRVIEIKGIPDNAFSENLDEVKSPSASPFIKADDINLDSGFSFNFVSKKSKHFSQNLPFLIMKSR